MPHGGIGAFMTELRVREGVAAKALEFLILTAARTGEVIGAKWSEIDLKACVWVIPGDRMKGGREHRVPLSEPAMAILKHMAMGREADHVFPRDRRDMLSNMAMDMLLRRMGRDDVTVHGFRSTFRDWCGEATAFQREIAEAALAHVVGDGTERAYRRGDALDKRRQLMNAWAGFCAKATVAGSVLPFKSTKVSGRSRR
jgi:integrase